jgi:hypothetical protein
MAIRANTRKRALGALLLIMTVGAVAPPAQADAAYEITPRHSGKCLDVQGASTASGALPQRAAPG